MSDASNPNAHIVRTSSIRFGMIDEKVFHDPGLSPTVKAVYGLLALRASDTRSAFPGRKTLAAQLGSSVRTVDAALQQGADAGLWTIQRRTTADGRSTSNLYLLHDFGGGFVPSNAPRAGRGAESAPLPEGRGEGADFVPAPGTESAPELDQGNHTTSPSPPARRHAGARRAARSLPRHSDDRRAELPAERHWLTHDNPILGLDILDHVVEAHGHEPPGLAALVDSMVGREKPPMLILNTALKAARESA